MVCALISQSVISQLLAHNFALNPPDTDLLLFNVILSVLIGVAVKITKPKNPKDQEPVAMLMILGALTFACMTVAWPEN